MAWWREGGLFIVFLAASSGYPKPGRPATSGLCLPARSIDYRFFSSAQFISLLCYHSSIPCPCLVTDEAWAQPIRHGATVAGSSRPAPRRVNIQHKPNTPLPQY